MAPNGARASGSENGPHRLREKPGWRIVTLLRGTDWTIGLEMVPGKK